MESILIQLKKNKPDISANSIKTYTSLIKSTFRKVFDEPIETITMSKLRETKKIISKVLESPISTRYTIMSALFAVTKENDYQEQMIKDIMDKKKQTSEQTKNEKQKEANITPEEINSLVNQYKKQAELNYKKPKITMNELQDIQNYIILVLYSGLYIPPRRALDYSAFRISGDINKETDNYIDGSNFVFNKYKTAKTYGRQVVKIPIQLKNIINKWKTVNDTGYLLFDTKKKHLSIIQLNQRLEKIIGKKFGVNGFRHSYLTEKYKNTIQQNKDIAEDLTEMGSSIAQATTYIQK